MLLLGALLPSLAAAQCTAPKNYADEWIDLPNSPSSVLRYNVDSLEKKHLGLSAPKDMSGVTCDGDFKAITSSTIKGFCRVPGGVVELTGCSNECIHPTDLGYTYSPKANLSIVGFDAKVTCAGGYYGTPVAVKCAAAGTKYTVSGCVKGCTFPTNSEGYDLSGIESIDPDPSKFKVTWKKYSRSSSDNVMCSEGYASLGWGPNPKATLKKCTSATKPFILEGCHKLCSIPTNSAYDLTKLNVKISRKEDYSASGAVCAPGYRGTALVSACIEYGGVAQLSGCVPACTVPPGYDFSAVAKSGEANVYAFTSFNMDNAARVAQVKCAKGWYKTSTITVKKCPAEGQPMVLTGCVQGCTTPSTAGYDFSNLAGSLQQNAFAPTGIKCAKFYEGTPATTTCVNPGEPFTATPSGCLPKCLRPTTHDGYKIVTETQLLLASFKVTVQCADGYEGTATATCPSPNYYQLSGCAEKACKMPTTMPKGYKGAGTTVPYSAPFNVVGLKCAVGWTGSAKVNKCVVDTEPYSFSGCHAVQPNQQKCKNFACPRGYEADEDNAEKNCKNPLCSKSEDKEACCKTEGLPAWAIFLIVLGSLCLCGGAGGYFWMANKEKFKQEYTADPPMPAAAKPAAPEPTA